MITKIIFSSKDFKEVLSNLNVAGKTLLVKPNWVGAYPGGYTDAKVIELLLSSLPNTKVIFLESYSFWRTDRKKEGKGDYFSSQEATMQTGKQHWEFFKKMDAWFLKETRIGDVLKKYDAKYLCITDEIWKGNKANLNKIESLVESKYPPVRDKDLYDLVPASILPYKGSPLISFAKAKIDSAYGFSGSIKNLFGLIPEPNRYMKYHGGDSEKLLPQSIIDINKIYNSLFNVKYLVESVFNYCNMDWDSETSTMIKGNGFVIASEKGNEADSEALTKFNTVMKGPLINLIDDYKSVFK